MTNLWMMGADDLAEIKKQHDTAMSSTDQLTKPPRNCCAEYDTHSELRLFGPLIARTNGLTQYLGINSTEGYMQEFDRLVETDKPIHLQLDGPGGQVSLLFEFADAIYNAGDQVSAHVSGTAASAHMLLFMAAQGGRTAHYGSVLGSMGVIGYLPYKYGDEIVSKNAKNKIPGKRSVQKRIDRVEKKYLENVAKYTGMSLDDVVNGSDKGAIFSGEEGLQRGFIDELATYKQTSERSSMSKETDTQPVEKSFTKSDVDKAATDAAAARDERWKKVLSHDNAKTNIDSAIHFIGMPVTDEQAFDSMNHVASGPNPVEQKTKPTAEEPTKDSPKESAKDVPADERAAIVAETIKQMRADAGTPVPAGGEVEDDGDEPKEPTQAEKDQALADAGADSLARVEGRR